jgi:DNA-binding transcriptional LysR family regulator
MAVNFHQLHIFYTVANTGNFSTAAQSLHMTQPGVTMQIQSLEDYYGTKLFRRSRKKVELTEAGKALMPYAETGIALIRDADRAMSQFTHNLEGKLNLGASLTFGEFILPRILGVFSSEYPHIGINMRVMNTTQILEEVLNHQLNFGLVESEVHHPNLHTESVLNDELKLILPAAHPLADNPKIHFEDILEYPFILREKGSGTRDVMEKEMLRCGADASLLRIVMEIGNTGAIKSAVEAGFGLSIMSPTAVKHEVALGLLTVRDIADFTFTRQFNAIYLDSTLLPISAVSFLAFLRERDLNQWLV